MVLSADKKEKRMEEKEIPKVISPAGGLETSSKTRGTREWAGKNVNIQIGCEHGCRYCYARYNAVCRFKRCTAEQWANPQVDRSKIRREYRLVNTTVMFPSSHDITPRNLCDCFLVLRKLLRAGNRVLIVSKPHRECVRILIEGLADWRRQVEFRFSITTADQAARAFWEPAAPGYAERIDCLAAASRAGYPTSVSIEPVLDTSVPTILADAAEWTNEIWVGRMNQLGRRMDPTGADDQEAIERIRQVLRLSRPEGVEQIQRLCGGFEKIIRWKDSMKIRD